MRNTEHKRKYRLFPGIWLPSSSLTTLKLRR